MRFLAFEFGVYGDASTAHRIREARITAQYLQTVCQYRWVYTPHHHTLYASTEEGTLLPSRTSLAVPSPTSTLCTAPYTACAISTCRNTCVGLFARAQYRTRTRTTRRVHTHTQCRTSPSKPPRTPPQTEDSKEKEKGTDPTCRSSFPPSTASLARSEVASGRKAAGPRGKALTSPPWRSNDETKPRLE
eukprot:3899211-Rhodomonas_salina.3